MTKQTVTMFS